jgi:hypothetical protein
VRVFPIAGTNEITAYTAAVITAATITAAARDCANAITIHIETEWKDQ